MKKLIAYWTTCIAADFFLRNFEKIFKDIEDTRIIQEVCWSVFRQLSQESAEWAAKKGHYFVSQIRYEYEIEI